jgi:hypothetical protein
MQLQSIGLLESPWRYSMSLGQRTPSLFFPPPSTNFMWREVARGAGPPRKPAAAVRLRDAVAKWVVAPALRARTVSGWPNRRRLARAFQ